MNNKKGLKLSLKLAIYMIVNACYLTSFSQTDSTITPMTPIASTINTEEEDNIINPLIWKLNSNGKRFVRLMAWAQIWAMASENNNGTLGANGTPIEGMSIGGGLRRVRMLFQFTISPRFKLIMHIGVNNQSFVSGGASGTNVSPTVIGNAGTGDGGKRPMIYFHDVYNEYTIIKDKLYIGAGLHCYNGISRMTSITTVTMATLDLPSFNYPTLENADQFARQLGIFARGTWGGQEKTGGLSYRIAINRPFTYGVSHTDLTKFNTITKKNIKEVQAIEILSNNNSLAYMGYFSLQLLEKESSELSATTGTYLGAKNVFNIGAGFYQQSKSYGSFEDTTSKAIKIYNQLNLGADIYLDKRLPNKGVINLYAAYYYNDQGKNSFRFAAVMNPYGGVQSYKDNPNASASGGGCTQPLFGTGHIWYTSLGYVFPKFKNGTALMPYAIYTLKNFERIGEVSNQYDIGINYFIVGHNAKISFQYSARPTYVFDGTSDQLRYDGLKGLFIIQTQIAL